MSVPRQPSRTGIRMSDGGHNSEQFYAEPVGKFCLQLSNGLQKIMGILSLLPYVQRFRRLNVKRCLRSTSFNCLAKDRQLIINSD